MRPPALASLLLGLASVLPAQQTWTVAAGGGAQFTQIDAAVAAAADGDVVLVAAGAYAPFVVDGKGLSIHGSGGMVVFQAPLGGTAPPIVTVRNLTAQQRFVMSKLTVFNSHAAPAAMLVHDCAGTVWLQDVFFDSFGAMALRVERCAATVLTDCLAQTNRAMVLPNGTPVPLPGAHLEASRVHAYQTTFRGSSGVLQGGGLPAPNGPSDGGAGLLVVDTWTELQGCVVRGGGGSSHYTGSCTIGGNGGPGLVLTTLGGAPPEARLRDVQVTGGYGGYYVASCATAPLAGPAQAVFAGQVVSLAGTARQLLGGGAVASGTATTFELRGRPGDVAFVFASVAAPAVAILDLPLHLSLPAISLGFRTLDGQGRAVLTLATPAFGPAARPLPLALQALALDAAGQPHATGPAALALH